MADNSIPVRIPYKNHPRRNPYGMLEYDYEALTDHQQRSLDFLKINTIREDHIYLQSHPEVRAIVCLLLRAIYNRRPNNVHEFARQFMREPRLREMVVDFLNQFAHENTSNEDQGECRNNKHPFYFGVFPCSTPSYMSGVSPSYVGSKSSATVDDGPISKLSEGTHAGRDKTVQSATESRVSAILDEIMASVRAYMSSPECLTPI